MSKFEQASPSSPRLESIKRPTRFHDTPPWTKVKASVDDVTGIGSHKSQQTSVQKTIGGAGQTAVWGSNWEPAEICFQKMIAALTTDNNVSFPPSPPPSTHATLSFQPRYRLWLRFLILVLVLSIILDRKEKGANK